MGVMSVSPAQCSALQVWLSSLHHFLEPIALAWFRAVVRWPAASRVFPPWVGFFYFASGFGGGGFGGFWLICTRSHGHKWLVDEGRTRIPEALSVGQQSALFPLSGSTALTRVLGIMELFPHKLSPMPSSSCRKSPFLWQGAVQKR